MDGTQGAAHEWKGVARMPPHPCRPEDSHPTTRKPLGSCLVGAAVPAAGLLLASCAGNSGSYPEGPVGFWFFVAVGFVAQMIDGALGMAYGVSSNSLLLSLGVPPAAASASVHAAEVVVTGISGASHWRLGNLDRTLVRRLLVPGVIGGVLGAHLLTSVSGERIKPFVALYLLLMGLRILVKAFNGLGAHSPSYRHLGLLGFVGGFFDAVGGGGWGPIVTTTLVARGNHPRYTVGSVNFSEFFVTLAESVTFLLSMSFAEYWRIIVGLLVGGAVAAPLAARVTQKVPAKLLMVAVGILICLLAARTLWLALVR